MTTISRTDTAVVARWWWTVDRWLVGALAVLMTIGVIMSFAASPAVAVRLGYSEFYFVIRHVAFAAVAGAVLFATSLFTPERLYRIAVLVMVASLVAIVATLAVGTEANGARRWIQLAGFSLQPAELFKPAFAVVCARLFAQRSLKGTWNGHLLATLLTVLGAGLVVMQPDLGMAMMILAIWGVEFFVAGLPVIAVIGLAGVACASVVGAYYALPHVASRIDRFLDPEAGDTYQIDQSLQAFANGGLFGTGPGEGVVKLRLPDAHADFVFAVMGEEFGMVVCAVVIGLFAFIVVRGLGRTARSENVFIMIAAAGLLALFGLQALVNVSSSMALIPTKGMTLPFISYGGSSAIAIGYGMGMVLALTRTYVGPLAASPRRRGGMLHA